MAASSSTSASARSLPSRRRARCLASRKTRSSRRIAPAVLGRHRNRRGALPRSARSIAGAVLQTPALHGPRPPGPYDSQRAGTELLAPPLVDGVVVLAQEGGDDPAGRLGVVTQSLAGDHRRALHDADLAGGGRVMLSNREPDRMGRRHVRRPALVRPARANDGQRGDRGAKPGSGAQEGRALRFTSREPRGASRAQTGRRAAAASPPHRVEPDLRR